MHTFDKVAEVRITVMGRSLARCGRAWMIGCCGRWHCRLSCAECTSFGRKQAPGVFCTLCSTLGFMVVAQFEMGYQSLPW